MGTLVRGAGPRYDVRPVKEQGGGLLPSFTGLAGMSKDVCQGACAGFLSLIGATHLTGGQSAFGATGSNIAVLDNLWASLSANGLAGPVELLGGIALFLAARRTISRTIGLLGFIIFAVAVANGYSVSDMLGMASSALEQLSMMLESAAVRSASVTG